MALPGSDVSTVVMNTSWHFLASVAISVHPVPAGNTLGVSPEAGGRVRRVALSGGGKGGSAQACGIEHPQNLARYFLYDRSLLSDLPAQAGWLGGAESLLHNRHPGPKGGTRCCCRHTNVRGFSTRISPPPAYPGFRWLFPRKRHVFRFSGH